MTQGASGTTSSTQRQLRTDSQLGGGVNKKRGACVGRMYVPFDMCHCCAGFVGVDELVGAYADHEVDRRKGKLRLPELQGMSLCRIKMSRE